MTDPFEQVLNELDGRTDALQEAELSGPEDEDVPQAEQGEPQSDGEPDAPSDGAPQGKIEVGTTSADEPREEPPADFIFRRDHRETALPRGAVEALAGSLGMSAAQTIETLQKGCNYDRLAGREGEAPQDRAWVDFFKRHRDLEAEALPEGMLARVRDGFGPEESYLACRLQEAEREAQALRDRRAASEKAPGSVSPETAGGRRDAFEEAFDSALRI